MNTLFDAIRKLPLDLELLINEFYPKCKKDYNTVMRQMMIGPHFYKYQHCLIGIEMMVNFRRLRSVCEQIRREADDRMTVRVEALIVVLTTMILDAPDYMVEEVEDVERYIEFLGHFALTPRGYEWSEIIGWANVLMAPLQII